MVMKVFAIITLIVSILLVVYSIIILLKNFNIIKSSLCESKTEKRYKSPLTLTQKGKIVAESVSKKVDEYVSLASIGLSEKDRKTFYESLILISNNLQKLCQKFD